MDIFEWAILTLPIDENRIFFHLCVLINFFQKVSYIYIFLLHRSFNSLDNFTLKCFIVFNAIVNWIFFKTLFFLDSLLLRSVLPVTLCIISTLLWLIESQLFQRPPTISTATGFCTTPSHLSLWCAQQLNLIISFSSTQSLQHSNPWLINTHEMAYGFGVSSFSIDPSNDTWLISLWRWWLDLI